MEDSNTDSESDSGSYIQKTPIMTSLMKHKVYKATRKIYRVETNVTDNNLLEDTRESDNSALDLTRGDAKSVGSIDAIALNLASKNQPEDAIPSDADEQKGKVEANMSTERNFGQEIKQEPVDHEQNVEPLSNDKNLHVEGNQDLLVERNQEWYYPCLHCYKNFSKIDSLKRHVRIHAETNVAIAVRNQSGQQPASERDKSESDEDKKLYFQCMYCEKSFSRKDSRKRHMDKLHANEIQNFDNNDMLKDTSVTFPESKIRGECSQARDGDDLSSDVKMEVDTDLEVTKLNDANDTAQVDDALYPCMYCHKGFKRKDSRKRHERIHTQEKPHKCSYCDKTFITKWHAREHESVHSRVKYFTKNLHKEFPTIGKMHHHDEDIVSLPLELKGAKAEENVSLVERDTSPHLEIVPIVSKPNQIEKDGCTLFTCHYCPKTFPRVDSRKRHERTHTGFKPHMCQFCGHSFITAYHKTLHERTHTKEKPHICSFCFKGFSRMDSLKRHEKVHSSIIDQLHDISGTEEAHNIDSLGP